MTIKRILCNRSFKLYMALKYFLMPNMIACSLNIYYEIYSANIIMLRDIFSKHSEHCNLNL